MNKEIEIPFGAFDSELKGWEYTIPEGMEAEIKDGKVIVREKESEDERIRKELKEAFESYDIESKWNGIPIRSIFAWLEKQKDAVGLAKQQGYEEGLEDGMSMMNKMPPCDIDKLKLVADYILTSWNGAAAYMVNPELEKIAKAVQEKYFTDNKPAEWSEEDEEKLKHTVSYLEGAHFLDNYIDWLKDLPNRFALQKPADWSDEDEKMRASIIMTLPGFNE